MNRRIYSNFFLDFFLIICPIWVALLYLYLINTFPEQRTLLFFIYLTIFGEIHFASTWLFFTSDTNRQWFLKEKINLIIIPAVLILIFNILGLINLSIAVFLVSAASAYHVTRQSIGIYRLFGGIKNSLYDIGIYALSILWLGIGFLRFMLAPLEKLIGFESPLPILMPNDMNTIAAIGVIIGLALFAAILLQTKKLATSFAFLTGAFLYSPYIFVTTPQDAVAIGVGMHWCQYIALTFKIYLNQDYKGWVASKLCLSNPIYKKIFYLACYAIAASTIQTNFGNNLASTSILILLPLSLQMYHFYFDSFIWRFSNPYIKNAIGGKIFQPNPNVIIKNS